MLDRRRGGDPPRMLCVDPRDTPVAREADVHLAPRAGTNLALMNGLQRELLLRGWIDEEWVRAHAIGLEDARTDRGRRTRPRAWRRSATSRPRGCRRRRS